MLTPQVVRNTFDGFLATDAQGHLFSRVCWVLPQMITERTGERVRIWIGRSILLVALIHTVFGVFFFGGGFAAALRAGAFDVVSLAAAPSADGIAFWFFVSGVLAFMLGGLVHYLERLGIAFPVFLPWGLLALTVAGCFLMPVSAWWLLFAPVVGMFVRQRHCAADNEAGTGCRSCTTRSTDEGE